jgi:hypothetical protein
MRHAFAAERLSHGPTVRNILLTLGAALVLTAAVAATN